MVNIKIEPYVRVQALIVANTYLGQLVLGYGLAWSSSAVLLLKDPEKTPLFSGVTVSDQAVAFTASLFIIGSVIGPHTTTFLSNVIGRKPCLLLGGLILGISFLILALAKNLTTIYIARFLCGWGVGIIFVLHLVYIGEIASTPVRGIFLSMSGIFFNSGVLLIFSLTPFLSYANTNYLGLTLSLIYLCGALLMPETPLFLVMKEKETQAQTILKRIKREDDFDTIISLKNQISATSKWSEVFTYKNNRKALVITVTLHILQHLSGYSTIISFVTIIFKLANSSVNAYMSTVLIGITQITGGILSPLFVERSGRRPLLLASTSVCCLSMALLATYFYLDEIKSPLTASIDWLPLVSLITYTMSYGVGFGIIPDTIIAEIYTLNARSVGATIAVSTGWTFAVLMTAAFGYVLQFGIHIVFWIFTACAAAACGVTFIFSYLMVPETKGKSLLEVQELMNL